MADTKKTVPSVMEPEVEPVVVVEEATPEVVPEVVPEIVEEVIPEVVPEVVVGPKVFKFNKYVKYNDIHLKTDDTTEVTDEEAIEFETAGHGKVVKVGD